MLNKEWFNDKINSFLREDETNKMTGVDGILISRCPVGAITFENRHDKQKCSEKVMGTIPYINEHYKIPIYSCEFC